MLKIVDGVVTVGSQSSLASVATTRYAAPQITSISTNAGGGLSGLSTDGRDRITMTTTRQSITSTRITNARYSTSFVGSTATRVCITCCWLKNTRIGRINSKVQNGTRRPSVFSFFSNRSSKTSSTNRRR